MVSRLTKVGLTNSAPGDSGQRNPPELRNKKSLAAEGRRKNISAMAEAIPRKIVGLPSLFLCALFVLFVVHKAFPQ